MDVHKRNFFKKNLVKLGALGMAIPFVSAIQNINFADGSVVMKATESSSDPTISTNPSRVGALWLNTTTGEIFVCTDNTSGSNIWSGQNGSGVSQIDVTHTSNALNDAQSQVTSTFSNQSLGAPDSTRKIVVATSGGGYVTASQGVIIAGVTASLLVRVNSSVESQYITELWQADVPTGTTGDIVVNWGGGGVNRCNIGVFRVIHAASSAYATATVTTGDPMTTTIDCPANSVVIAVACDELTSSYTWTNLDKAYDQASEATDSGAIKKFSSAQSVSVTAYLAGTFVRSRMAIVSFGSG